MTTTAPDARAAEGLQQVRTAYRLVHAYHRRLFDLFLVIKEAVERRHGAIERSWWGPTVFSRPPKGSSDVTERWVYDFLPLQNARFVWASCAEPTAGGWLFGIHHTPDSALAESARHEPDPLALGDAANARSELQVWAVAVRPDHALTWDGVEAAVDGVDARWWESRTVHRLPAPNDGIAMAGFHVDLAAAWTLDGARASVVHPIVELLAGVRAAVQPVEG